MIIALLSIYMCLSMTRFTKALRSFSIHSNLQGLNPQTICAYVQNLSESEVSSILVVMDVAARGTDIRCGWTRTLWFYLPSSWI